MAPDGGGGAGRATGGKAPFRVEAVLPATDAQTYFLERDSAAFRSLLSKVLKIGQMEVRDSWREGGSSYVRLVTKPEFGAWVPTSVANQLQAGQLEFHDVIRYDPACISSSPYTIFVRTESPFLKDKLDVRLTLSIEALEGGACRQVLEGHIRVRMFGVGRIVERIVKESLNNTYRQLPEIVRRWQLLREDLLRSGDGRKLLLGRPPVGCEVGWIRREVRQVLQGGLPDDCAAGPPSPSRPAPATADGDGGSAPAPAREQSPQRAQQRRGAAAEPVEEAAAAEAATAAHRPQQQHEVQTGAAAQQTEPAGVGELLGARRSSMGPAPSGPSEFFDARESLAGEGDAPGGEAPRGGLASLAGALLARGAHHRRGLSSGSVTSTDTPPAGEGDGPPLPRRHWRRFNRDYGEWETYWDAVGVEAAPGPEQAPEARGVVARAVHAAEQALVGTYHSAAIFCALALMRNGWLRVTPDAGTDEDDEQTRRHASHCHASTHSSGGEGVSATRAAQAAGTDVDAPVRAQSLARVAQEVQKRLVTGSRAVAAAPARAVAAAGASVRGASWGELFSRPPRDRAGRGSVDGGAEGSVPAPAPAVQPAAPAQQAAGISHSPARPHRQALSLDAHAAAEAQRVAAAAVEEHERRRTGAGGARARGTPPPGLSPSKALERRPSNVASAAAMASMRRQQDAIEARPAGHARTSCLGVCRRAPAVKD